MEAQAKNSRCDPANSLVKSGVSDSFARSTKTDMANIYTKAIMAALGAGILGRAGLGAVRALTPKAVTPYGPDTNVQTVNIDPRQEEEDKIVSAYPALTKAAFWPFSSKPEWKPPAYPDFEDFMGASDDGTDDYDGHDAAEEDYYKQMRKYLESQNYTDIRESYGGPWRMRGPDNKYYGAYGGRFHPSATDEKNVGRQYT